MLMTRTFKPTNNGRVHIVHETKTAATYGFVNALCGKQFPGTVVIGKAKATCPRCIKLDNPFDLTGSQELKLYQVVDGQKPSSHYDDLVKRDLVNPTTMRLTPRGEVLVADLKQHPPWAGHDGVIHARNAIARKRGICGADLDGINGVTYAQLDKLIVIGRDLKVTCLECMLEV